MKRAPVIIGITVGDVNGVGPEVVLKALGAHQWPKPWKFVVIGPARILSQQAEKLRLPMWPTVAPGRVPDDTDRVVWDVDIRGLTWTPGAVTEKAAQASLAALEVAVQAALGQRLSCVVTGPIHKEGWARAGMGLIGHTEWLAKRCGGCRVAMMLMGRGLRVVLVTRHVPIARVSEMVTREAVATAIERAMEALPMLGVSRPRVAVCALNPHGGEGGRLGEEERTIIAPEIRRARRRGWDVVGPVSADVAFYEARKGTYDAVVAQYHDQGLAPLKMIAFETGVNWTLGLPIIRTSPDHGTALDRAGRGIADPRSMTEAIRWAGLLADRENPWRRS